MRRPGVRIPSRPPDFKELTLFLKTGRCPSCQLASAPEIPSDCSIEIHNNTAERALRTVALGRKNYGLIGTAKLNGIDPEA
jgi:hypothetical protein